MGFNVVVYDAFDKGLEASKKAFHKHAELFSMRRGMKETSNKRG
jgi:3-hydroxybutyryl-CoA dehydrogenase